MTDKVTKLLIILACAGVLSLFTAAATPLPTCANDWSIATYISVYNPGGGCVIGDKIFSNFSYIASGNNAISRPSLTFTTYDFIRSPSALRHFPPFLSYW